MRRLLKVILLAFICTAGAMGLVLGGLYLFGALDEKPVYAESLSFSEAEVVKSGPFSLTVNTTTENVNKKTLVLETSKSPNGDAIISYPKYITIGEPFHIAPILTDNIPVGGYLELYARYEGEGSNQSAVATCKILIDVPVTSAKLNIDTSSLKQGCEISLSKANTTKLSDILTISSANSLMPYANSTKALNSIANGTLFAGQNIVNKKIFLKITATNSESPSAIFQIGEGANITESTETELTYTYLGGQLVATKTISIITQGNNLNDFVVSAYVCTSYANNAVEMTDLDNLAVSAVSTAHKISVINYTIDTMTLTNNEGNIYLGQTTKLYLNNPNVEDGSLNLGIDISSSNGKTTNDLKSFLNEKIFVKFEDNSIGGIISRADGSQTDTDVEYGLNCMSSSTEMDQWYLNIFVSNYQKYLDYIADSNKKIKLIVTFYDKEGSLGSGQSKLEKEFSLIPTITEVDEVESTQYKSTAMSGSKLIFNGNYSIKFENNETPVGIAREFKIVHYVKGELVDGKVVLNGVTIDAEFTQKTLNSENICIFDPKNANVTGSGTFKIYSQASYDDTQNSYFLGESCQTDIEVVEAISYIDCYSYEDNNPVTFTKFSFEENEKTTDGSNLIHYLYVTTSDEQIPKLKNFVEKNKLVVSFKQITGLADETLYNTATLGTGLKDQNKNTIEFGTWTPVLDTNGTLVGYKISYTIGEVVTMQIDDYIVPNKFEISVYLDVSPVQVTTNYKIASGNATTLQYEIKDKILQNTILSLGSKGTEVDPIELTATVNGSGDLSWSGATLSELTYGFAYDGKSDPESISGYSAKFEIIDDSSLNGICTFTPDAQKFKGGISFSTLPYKEGGYLGKFTFWCNTYNNENLVKKWNGTSFDSVVNPSLGTKVLYFKLIGLNLIVEANSTAISGQKNSSVNMFKNSQEDNTALFTLKNIEGSTEKEIYSGDYSQFLSASGMMNKEELDKIEIDVKTNQVKTTADFISDSFVTFQFSCKDKSIKIRNGKNTVNNISKTITGVFSVSRIASTDEKALGEDSSTPLLAPSLTALAKNDYLKITYAGGDVGDTFVKGYTLSFVKRSDTADWLVLGDDGNITLKTINNANVVSTSFDVKIAKENSTESCDFMVTIYAKSSISSGDLIIKSTNDEQENIIPAGTAISYTEGISFKENSSLATFALNNKITKVNLTVDYAKSSVKNFIKTTNFQQTTTNTSLNNAFGFYSGDLASDQTINVKFEFTFGNAGTFTISKDITITSNFSLTLVTNRKTETNQNGYDGYDFKTGDDFKVFSNDSYKEDIEFDSAIYADDTIADHPHIKDLDNLSIRSAGEVIVLIVRGKNDTETENSIVKASFVLGYVYKDKDGDLEYTQDIKFEFDVMLTALES